MLSDYPDILTSEDACKLLKISKNTLYKLIHSGQIALGSSSKIPLS